MRARRRNDEEGIALVLALMALLLLTFLGLTLATTTSTELQIATNYRWSQQAFYNAEAGIEAAKRALATADWSVVLPPPRTTPTWVGNVNPTAAAGTVSGRDYENWNCDQRGNGVGYGRVLVAGGTTFSDVSALFSQNLNGSVTLWVRRSNQVHLESAGDPLNPPDSDPDTVSGQYRDKVTNDELVLTAEAIAPYRGQGSATAQSNRAIRTMEVVLARSLTETDQCGTRRGGQAGGGPEGAGFGGCMPIDASSVDRALGLNRTGPAPESTER